MAKITWKAGTMLYPLPAVMVTSGTMEKANIFTAAWTGIVNSEPAMTYVSIRPERFSHALISKNGEFVINLTNEKLLHAADFCGVRSGKDTDKFEQTGLTKAPCAFVKAPQIEESPISLECRVVEVKRLGSHDLFLAEILAVNVDDSLLDETGRLALEKSDLVAFCHGEYRKIGAKLGKFGFSVEKKKSRKQRIREIKTERKARKAARRDDAEKIEKPAETKKQKQVFDKPVRRSAENGVKKDFFNAERKPRNDKKFAGKQTGYKKSRPEKENEQTGRKTFDKPLKNKNFKHKPNARRPS